MEFGTWNLKLSFGGVAQLARAPDLHSGGHRFDPVRLHSFFVRKIETLHLSSQKIIYHEKNSTPVLTQTLRLCVFARKISHPDNYRDEENAEYRHELFFLRKSYTLYFLLPSAFLLVKAQSFQPVVIGSAGTFATSASGSMSWTIGEVMTETYSSANNFFTQGFHQPESIPISVNEYSSSQNISIYPNPVVDNLIIDFSSASGNYSLYIYDMLGQKIYARDKGQGTGVGGNTSTINHLALNPDFIGKPLTIDMKGFANGMYFLNIINSESNTGNSYKINKTE